MYRSYLKAQAVEADASPKEPEDDDGDVEESVKEAVNKVWQDVEKQCKDQGSATSAQELEEESVLEWNTVRVFVSSTFTDFFSEREVLVKKVFPELREWCVSRGLKLVECDLRWGIPRDTPSSETILVCLDEIERCREINKGQPFFINLVAERYGWIPTGKEVPDEAREKYGWVENSSITFMEIMHGALREKNPNAAFFIRDKSVCDAIPESFIKRFVDEEPVAKYHLKVLKRKIKQRFPNQVFDYNCKFKQISTATGREQVELAEMEDFAEQVLTFLKSAIERMYPSPGRLESEVDVIKQEQDVQWLFALDQARDLFGRQSELEILDEFIKQGSSDQLEETEGTNGSIRLAEEWDLHETDSKICVIESSSGFGKTALVCKLLVNAVKSGTKVFYHLVGSSSSSIRVDWLLRRLLHVLIPEPSERSTMESGRLDEKKELLRKALSDYRESDNPLLVIILDGMNELESSDTISHLSWLPPSFPHNIRCILTTNSHLPTTARVYEHPALKMALPAMPPEDLSAVAVRYLATFNKTLEKSQLEMLMSNTQVDNPLWIMLMAEELRIFGDFRVMDSKIKSFPNTMEGMLVHILDRLLAEDDENEVVKKVLCLIACSRHGLPTDKALQICGDMQAKEELPPLYWARARRVLKFYLRASGGMGETVTFAHEAVTRAVCGCLLDSEAEKVRWHTVLADYYQYWCDDASLKVYHLPYHLERAGLKKRMVEFMQKDPDSYMKIHSWQRSYLLKNCRCRGLADAVIPATAPVMLCQACAPRVRGFNPACTWQNKSCCVICGMLCNTMKQIGARACMRHAQSRGPNGVKCALCNFAVDTKVKTGPLVPTQAQLCMHCGFGNGDKTCATFDV